MKIEDLFEDQYFFTDAYLFESQLKQMFQDEFMERLSLVDRHARNDISNWIRTARQKLKKNDRIIWFLRNVRLWYVNVIREYDRSQEGREFVEKEIKRYNKKTKETRLSFHNLEEYTMPPSTIMSQLEHFLDRGIHAIDTHVFGWELPYQLFTEFDDIEEEWKKLRRRFIEDNDEEEFLDVGDGFVWFDLERPYCKQEGDAMGHCGNVSGGPGETILSLRQKQKISGETWWKPVATFILHKNSGNLGQMKGYGNDKPSPKYHKYIVPLLLDRRIHGIQRGEYLPENDFSIDDLSPELQKKVLDKKPELADVSMNEEEFESRVEQYINDEEDNYIQSEVEYYENEVYDVGDIENSLYNLLEITYDDKYEEIVKIEKQPEGVVPDPNQMSLPGIEPGIVVSLKANDYINFILYLKEQEYIQDIVNLLDGADTHGSNEDFLKSAMEDVHKSFLDLKPLLSTIASTPPHTLHNILLKDVEQNGQLNGSETEKFLTNFIVLIDELENEIPRDRVNFKGRYVNDKFTDWAIDNWNEFGREHAREQAEDYVRTQMMGEYY